MNARAVVRLSEATHPCSLCRLEVATLEVATGRVDAQATLWLCGPCAIDLVAGLDAALTGLAQLAARKIAPDPFAVPARKDDDDTDGDS